MEAENLLTYVADIVSAHVSNNAVSTSDLPTLIQSVHASLSALGKEPEPEKEKQTPAVSVRASVKSDAIACLECGERLKMLKRHLNTDHQLTPAEYRSKWSLPANYPMVAPDYAEKRRALAVKIGLGRKSQGNIRRGAKAKQTTEARKKLSPAFHVATES